MFLQSPNFYVKNMCIVQNREYCKLQNMTYLERLPWANDTKNPLRS